MYSTSTLCRLFATFALVVTFAAAAHAQATRTWVSGVGDDVNPCSRTAPCKTFQGAISKTAAGGEISVLDSGGFGAITITKSITINGTGPLSGILAALTNGVIVNAGPNDTVILRDLSINGAGTGLNGVRFLSGGNLTIDHCSIYGFKGNATSRGIDVALGGNGSLNLIDTIVESVAEDGLHVTTTAGLVVTTIENSQFIGCGQDGVEAVANVRGALTHSRVVYCSANGVSASGNNTQINVNDVFVAHCDSGLRASAGSSVRASDSVIANNSTGLAPNGGTIDSFQGNSLIGNPVVGAFTTTTQKQ